MNTDNGKIYRTPEEIEAAKERGEPIAMVSEQVARAVETGMRHMNRHERRKAAALARRKGK